MSIVNMTRKNSSRITRPEKDAELVAGLVEGTKGIKTSHIETVSNKGTVATGSTVEEFGDGYNNITKITLDTTLGAIAGGANLALGKLVYTFPAGAIIVKATRINVAITQSEGNITADTPDVGVGTTLASGAVAVLGGTAGFENMLTGQTAADCDGTATSTTLATTLVIGLSGDRTVYFNVADGWAASGDAAATLTGEIIIEWKYMN